MSCVANVSPFRVRGGCGSFRAREAKALSPALIFSQGHLPDAPVQSLGTRLAVGLQGAPDHGGNLLCESHSAGDDLQQLLAREPLERFVVEREDGLVAARIALASCPPEQLAIDAA